MQIKIATHNGTFHADEVTAIALLQYFIATDTIIDRLPHQTTSDLSQYDYVIDIGREYDGITRFDHHQWEGGKSSAGLIWEYIKEDQSISNTLIDEWIQAIDDNDVGTKPATTFEYSRLLSTYNWDDIHDTEQQMHQFELAVAFAYDIVCNKVRVQDQINKAKRIVASAKLWPGRTDILLFSEWPLNWEQLVNGETMPEIEAVVWHESHLDTWNIQTTNVSTTSYKKVGKSLLPWDKMDFVHSANFFAVASTKKLMDEYINNYFSKNK